VQHWNLLSTPAPQGTRDPVVLLSKEGVARAVLIALQPGQSLGEHQVKEHAWVVVVDGSVTAHSDGSSEEFQPGGLVHFEPDERHSLVSETGARVLMLLAPWPGEGHYRGQRNGG
jgi:quercetin dioxygenase-like cupin family protein